MLTNKRRNRLTSDCLKLLISELNGHYNLGEEEPEEVNKFLTKIMLLQIKKGIKNQEDNVRCDFVHVLQNLVVHCSHICTKLQVSLITLAK